MKISKRHPNPSLCIMPLLQTIREMLSEIMQLIRDKHFFRSKIHINIRVIEGYTCIVPISVKVFEGETCDGFVIISTPIWIISCLVMPLDDIIFFFENRDN